MGMDGRKLRSGKNPLCSERRKIMTSMGSNNQGGSSGGGNKGGHNSPLTDATFNMISALHNLTKSLWKYDEYISQESDSDAREMWQRFKQTQTQLAEELKNHLSRRLQHETGPQGKVGAGPNQGESGGSSSGR
jgi:hypothetical protein